MGVAESFDASCGPNVLHLCGDYAKQRLYSELFINLSMLGTKQFIYVPVRTTAEVGKYQLKNERLSFRYSQLLRKHHRLFFRSKIRAIFKDILLHVDINQFKVMHAHFLYSDGAVARMINKRTGMPYVVSVRNTDINFFMKWRPDLRLICWDILRHASNVIFLSPAYKELMIQRVPAEIRYILQERGIVVPNGLDALWMENDAKAKAEYVSPLRVIYVGDFSSNKNILNTMKAVRLVCQERKAVLTLVGGGGDGEEVLFKYLMSGEWPFVKRVDRIADRSRLRDIIQSHDIFVMPSYFETFGLVYIEALSQGLPVVHSRGQGIDGYFPNEQISIAVDPYSPESIAAGILALAKRLPSISINCIKAAREFSWPDIASRYQKIYRNLVS